MRAWGNGRRGSKDGKNGGGGVSWVERGNEGSVDGAAAKPF